MEMVATSRIPCEITAPDLNLVADVSLLSLMQQIYKMSNLQMIAKNIKSILSAVISDLKANFHSVAVCLKAVEE